MSNMFASKFQNQNPAAPAPTANTPKWAKSGFLNFDLPDPKAADGFAKFGAIGIEINNVRHQKLLAWLNENNGAHFDERINIVRQSFRITYRGAEKDESVGFLLPGM
jgi:hypothetical protein